MTYDLFVKKLLAMFPNEDIKFLHTEEKFTASIDGIQFIANSIAPSVSVLWGDGHLAQFTL